MTSESNNHEIGGGAGHAGDSSAEALDGEPSDLGVDPSAAAKPRQGKAGGQWEL